MNDETYEPMADQLEGSLLDAVNQIKAEPVPAGSLTKTLELASRIDTRRVRPWRRLNTRFYAAAGVAAGLLIFTLIWSVGDGARSKYEWSRLPEDTVTVAGGGGEALFGSGKSRSEEGRKFDGFARGNYHSGDENSDSRQVIGATSFGPAIPPVRMSNGVVSPVSEATYDQGPSLYMNKAMPAAVASRSVKRPSSFDSTGNRNGQTTQVWRRDRQRPTFARVYVGDGNSLELVSLQVTTTIEGPRARTVVDHIFRNPHDRQLEGTFEYPLPTGASASYFAMFLGQTRDAVPPRFNGSGDSSSALPSGVAAKLTPAEIVKLVSSTDWGTLREARIVPKEKALETYEDIVRGRIDPALLEYAGGNTFSGRVFPIPAKGYNRVLIAYEELLPYTQAGVQYRFPLPDCKMTEVQLTLQANLSECRESAFRAPKGFKEVAGTIADGRRLTYSRTWKDKGPGGDALFTFTPPQPDVQVTSGRQSESGPLYVYARLRPELKSEADTPFADHAVFLLDTSLSEHPDRFAVNMKLLRRILEADSHIKQFNILTFDVGARWLQPKGWLQNTEGGRKVAFDQLEGIVLEGATDLSAALDKLAATPRLDDGSPLNVFLLSDGQITWGESNVAALLARFESRSRFQTRFYCYRTGIGADNVELFEALTRSGGGIFNCFGEADLAAAAGAHRSQCMTVERINIVDGPAVSDLLVAGRKASIYPGGELVLAARASQPGRCQVVLEGTYLGKKIERRFPLEVTGSGEMAPRGWGEIAVASLLGLNDPQLDSLVTAYCQQFGIGSRAASFLVLENESDYKRLNLEEERGKTVPNGDVGQFLLQMSQAMGKTVSDKKAFEAFLAKVEARMQLTQGQNGAHVKKLLGLLTEADFALAESALEGALLKETDVPAAYLGPRKTDPRNVGIYVAEARRRTDARDLDGAVRVLSSVVEEYPGRADALRLVGYRLLDLKQPAQAVRLFRQVQQNRPFEPHSYRDLARSLEENACFALASVQYEIVLAGVWHNRFGQALKMVAEEEYARMMRQAIRQKAVSKALADHFGERLEGLTSSKTRSDLRITISWNTDATDVDLWVIEPDGTKCFYSNASTKNGGRLSQDQTQGYGPERYQIENAKPGVYTVIVHYFRGNPNLLAGETHVNVAVTRHADTPQEENQRYNVILKSQNEQVEVCRVKF